MFFQDLYKKIRDFFVGINYVDLTINILLIILGVAVIYLITRLIFLALKKITTLPSTKKRHYQRRNTITKLLSSALDYAFFIISFIYILTFFNVSSATLITGVGALGIIFTFAFQDLIKDIVAGVFIIIENSYDVDDVVTIGGMTGKVENITLRSTTLNALTGEKSIIRNALVGNIVNHSKAEKISGKIVVSISQDLVDSALKVLNEALNKNQEKVEAEIIGVVRINNGIGDLEIVYKSLPLEAFKTAPRVVELIETTLNKADLKYHKIG